MTPDIDIDLVSGILVESSALDQTALKMTYRLKGSKAYYSIYTDGIYFKSFRSLGRALTVFRSISLVGSKQFKHIAWHANHVVTERSELDDCQSLTDGNLIEASNEAFERLGQTRH